MPVVDPAITDSVANGPPMGPSAGWPTRRRSAARKPADHARKPRTPAAERSPGRPGRARRVSRPPAKVIPMQKWEYATVPLLVHATKQILDNWGDDGWELVARRPGSERRAARRLHEAAEGMTAPGHARGAAGRAGPDAARGGPAAAAYVPAVRTGNYVYTAGPAAVRGRQAAGHRQGRRRGDAAEGPALARLCALNALAAAAVGGRRARPITRIVKVVGFVASAPDFTGQPQVINGASELLSEVFGEAGKHARSAVGRGRAAAGRPGRGRADRRGGEPRTSRRGMRAGRVCGEPAPRHDLGTARVAPSSGDPAATPPP